MVGYGYFLEFHNNNKCKELRISFAKQEAEFDPIVVNGKALECVQSAKLLGVTISSDLRWNNHVNEIVNEIEQIQKRALSIIYPGLSYNDALEHANILKVNSYCEAICSKTFFNIIMTRITN